MKLTKCVVFWKAKAEEELQETQGQIDSLLKDLSSLSRPATKRNGFNGAVDVVDSAASPPEGAVKSHTDMLQVRHYLLPQLLLLLLLFD